MAIYVLWRYALPRIATNCVALSSDISLPVSYDGEVAPRIELACGDSSLSLVGGYVATVAPRHNLSSLFPLPSFPIREACEAGVFVSGEGRIRDAGIRRRPKVEMAQRRMAKAA